MLWCWAKSLGLWVEAGFDPDRFFDKTPRLYRIAMEAKGRAAETAHEHRAWLAWQTASLTAFAFHDPRKMPALDGLIGKKPAVTLQTPDQMKAAFAAWRASAK